MVIQSKRRSIEDIKYVNMLNQTSVGLLNFFFLLHISIMTVNFEKISNMKFVEFPFVVYKHDEQLRNYKTRKV